MSPACSRLSRRDAGVRLGRGRTATFGVAVLAAGVGVGVDVAVADAVGAPLCGDGDLVMITRDSHARRGTREDRKPSHRTRSSSISPAAPFAYVTRTPSP